MTDILTIKFPAMERYEQSSRLEVSFTPISTDELSVDISATIGTFRNSAGPLDFRARTLCYGYDLAEFSRDLKQLNTSYEGNAKFLNQVESFELTLTLANKGSGILTVVARYEHDTDYMSPVELRCFRLEQSYLSDLLADIRQFLAESGVSTAHPFVHDAP